MITGYLRFRNKPDTEKPNLAILNFGAVYHCGGDVFWRRPITQHPIYLQENMTFNSPNKPMNCQTHKPPLYLVTKFCINLVMMGSICLTGRISRGDRNGTHLVKQKCMVYTVKINDKQPFYEQT